MNDRENGIPTVDSISEERKHLEGLLKDRFNFYVVFASVFIIGAFKIKSHEHDLYIQVVSLGTLVSFLLFLAILRTYVLVHTALMRLKEDTSHPYSWLCKEQKYIKYNANHIMIIIPVIVTLFGIYLILRSSCA